jgi:hypothetical protein
VALGIFPAGKFCELSFRYMVSASAHCRKLLVQAPRLPASLALASAGSSMAARIAMMAITTSNSMRVNAADFPLFTPP